MGGSERGRQIPEQKLSDPVDRMFSDAWRIHTRFPVVGDNQTARATEEFDSSDMRVDPVSEIAGLGTC